MLAVGGWNAGMNETTVMLSTEESRAEFIRTTIVYLRDHHFDGLDLDFEYPGSRGSPPQDREKFTKLVQVNVISFYISENEYVWNIMLSILTIVFVIFSVNVAFMLVISQCRYPCTFSYMA